jgi:putative transposase
MGGSEKRRAEKRSAFRNPSNHAKLTIMPDYRRNRVPGATYFFTVNLLDRRSNLLVTEINALRQAVRQSLTKSPFHIDAWVVLPEHMHTLWTLPENDSDFSGRWRGIKTAFTKSLPPTEHRSPVNIHRGERGIWQRRFWEHTIRDADDYAAHMDYIHFNPVKHRIVQTVAAWPYSSFHRCVANGLYPSDWLGSDDEPREAGERAFCP